MKAAGLVETDLFFEVDDDVQAGTRGRDKIFSAPCVAQAADSHICDVESETIGRRSLNEAPNLDQVIDFADPLGELAGLLGIEGIEERIGALFFLEGIDFDLEVAVGS